MNVTVPKLGYAREARHENAKSGEDVENGTDDSSYENAWMLKTKSNRVITAELDMYPL